MTSSLVSIRPASQSGSTVTLGGAAPTAWQATSDNIDSTYITNGTVSLAFGATPLADNDQIIGLSLRYRLIKPGATPPETTQEIVLPGFGAQPWFLLGSAYASIAGWAASPSFTSIGSHKITPADLADLIILVNVPSSGRFLEVYLDVTYNAAPVDSTLTPSGTVNIAAQTYSWTYNDTEADAEAEVDLIVYPAAVVTALGMTSTLPDTTDAGLAQARFFGFGTAALTAPGFGATLTHGTPGGTSSYFNPARPLPNGDYRVYVRSGDAAVFARRSAWISSDFTVLLPAPRTPAIVVNGPYDTRFGRVPLLISAFENLLSPTVAGAEGTTGDYDLVNATAILDTTAAHLWSDPVNGEWTSTKALRLTASSAANMSAKTHDAVLVDVGELLLGGAHVTSVTSRLATAAITFYDTGGGTLSTVTGAQVPTAAGDEPTFVHVVATAPALAQFARVTIMIVGPANSEQHWVDDWIIAPTKKGALQDSHLWNGNLVSNTSFESYAGSSDADWTLVTNGAGQTVGAITETTVDGVNALQIQKNETTFAPPYAQWPDTAGGQPLLPVAAGDVIIATGYFKRILVGGVDGVFTIEAVYNDGTHDQISCIPLLENHRETFVAAFQIPAGKTGVSIRFLPQTVGTTGSKGEVHIDLINIYRASTRAVAVFHALGGASGTPLGSGHNNTSLGLRAFHLAAPAVPFFEWQQGGMASGVAFTVERSIDAGVTWTPVRAVPARADNLTITMFDYEAPPNALVMYRATTNTFDVISDQFVSSMPSGPILSDPGFENQSWFDMSTDPLLAQFQPPNGKFVGALNGVFPTGIELDSPFGQIPDWAAQLGTRFLSRLINATSAHLAVYFFNATQDGENLDTFNDAPQVPIAGSADDTGWTRITVPVFFRPPIGRYLQVRLNAVIVPDPTQSTLVALDTVEIWPVDADGLAPVVQTPTCLQWLKDPLNPGANLACNIEVVGLSGSGNGNESTSTESQLAMAPSGRPDTIVIADDTIGAEIFSTLQFILRNDAEYAAFETLRHAQRTLLAQFPYGDLAGEQRYIRFGPVRTVGRVSTQDQAQGQRRRVTVQAYEVAPP